MGVGVSLVHSLQAPVVELAGAAHCTGGVWVGKFLKTCTHQRMTPAAARELAAVTERQCKLENMLAHAQTARARLERYRGA